MAVVLMTLMLAFPEMKLQRTVEKVGFVRLLVGWLLSQYCTIATRSFPLGPFG
jgi:hypothetical protein